jgi:hypothetical protein
MADDDILKVDRRGTTILVPLGLVLVFAVIVGLMMWHKANDVPRQGPSGAARPGAAIK